MFCQGWRKVGLLTIPLSLETKGKAWRLTCSSLPFSKAFSFSTHVCKIQLRFGFSFRSRLSGFSLANFRGQTGWIVTQLFSNSRSWNFYEYFQARFHCQKRERENAFQKKLHQQEKQLSLPPPLPQIKMEKHTPTYCYV